MTFMGEVQRQYKKDWGRGARAAAPLTLGTCFVSSTGASRVVLQALRRGLPLDTSFSEESVRTAREAAAKNGDVLAAQLDGCKVYEREIKRTVDPCSVCGGEHEWHTSGFDDGAVDKRGRVGVRYECGGVDLLGTATARVRTLSVKLPNGDIQHIAEPRWLLESWEADPERLQRGLLKCSRDAVIRQRSDGKMIAVPCGCGGSMCPRCMHSKASKRVKTWEPYFRELTEAGCVSVHVTLTQVADQYDHMDLPITGANRVAVPGEQLGAASDRLRKSWYKMRNSSKSRAGFSESVVGYVYGTEATGRSPTGRGSRGRYHMHNHALLVLAPGVLDDAVLERVVVGCQGCGGAHQVSVWSECREGMTHWCPKAAESVVAISWSVTVVSGTWWDWWRETWLDCSEGASNLGQVARVITGGDDEARENALREVLKYPFKPAEFTLAQTVEWNATMKGRRLHLSGGCLHPSSLLRKAAKGVEGALEDVPLAKLALVEPIRKALLAGEEQKENAETYQVIMRTMTALDVWQPATVRMVLKEAGANEGLVQVAVWDPRSETFSRVQILPVQVLLGRLIEPPKAENGENLDISGQGFIDH